MKNSKLFPGNVYVCCFESKNGWSLYVNLMKEHIVNEFYKLYLSRYECGLNLDIRTCMVTNGTELRACPSHWLLVSDPELIILWGIYPNKM